MKVKATEFSWIVSQHGRKKHAHQLLRSNCHLSHWKIAQKSDSSNFISNMLELFLMQSSLLVSFILLEFYKKSHLPAIKSGITAFGNHFSFWMLGASTKNVRSRPNLNHQWSTDVKTIFYCWKERTAAQYFMRRYQRWSVFPCWCFCLYLLSTENHDSLHRLRFW